MNNILSGAYQHFNQRLKERFDIEMSYDDFLKYRVLNRTVKKKYIGKYKLYLIDDIVHVYYITKKYEYPITVYELNRFNKGKLLKTINK